MATKTAKRINKKPSVRYIVNLQGQKTEAVVPISVYRRLLEQAEELEDIRHFDKAIKDLDFIPWEKAKRQLGLWDRAPKGSDAIHSTIFSRPASWRMA